MTFEKLSEKMKQLNAAVDKAAGINWGQVGESEVTVHDREMGEFILALESLRKLLEKTQLSGLVALSFEMSKLAEAAESAQNLPSNRQLDESSCQVLLALPAFFRKVRTAIQQEMLAACDDRRHLVERGNERSALLFKERDGGAERGCPACCQIS